MKLREIFLFIILLFTVYQDFPLKNVFGEIARSPIVFCLPIFGLYFVLNPKIKLSQYSKYFLLYILYIIVVTLIHLFFLIITNQEIYFLGENILIKAIKMAIYPLVAFVYYQFVYTFLNKNENRFNILFKILFALEVLLVIYMIFEVYYSKTPHPFMTFLHSSNDKYWRIRLLTFEESWIGTVITIISFTTIYLSIYLNKSARIKRLVLFTSIFFIGYYTIKSESKGYMLLFLVSTLPMLIKSLYLNKKTRNLLIVSGAFIFISGVYVFFSLEHYVSEQLYTSVSFGTRFSSYLAAIKNFIYHPFGVGWGPHLYYYTNSLRSVIESTEMSNFNLGEVKGYLETSKSLSSKTYFFNNLVYGGVPFLLFFYLFFIKRIFTLSKIKAKHLMLLKIPLLFIILSSFLYVTFEIKYEVWFFLAFVDVLSNKLKNQSFE
jgi:hypothetical protein